jgi:hypothetical protein
MKRYLNTIFGTHIPGVEFETGYLNRVTKAPIYYTIQNCLSLALKDAKMNHGNYYWLFRGWLTPHYGDINRQAMSPNHSHAIIVLELHMDNKYQFYCSCKRT